MGPPPRITRATTHRGFTLVEILVVLVIVGILLTMAAVLTRGVSAAQKRALTATRIAAIDTALVQFVMQQRRLPCPADGSTPSGGVSVLGFNAGVEARDGAGNCTPADQKKGVVPWATLGLSEAEATDGWDRRFTFRLDTRLALNNGMDMSWCDPAGTEGPPAPPPRACSNTCSTVAPSTVASCTPPSVFLNSKGLTIKNLPPPPALQATVMDPSGVPNTGAAYVVISHGESGGGGYLNSGQLGSHPGDGNEEMKNYASLPNAGAVTYYVDDLPAAGAVHFDDMMSRPSVLGVITKAGLGPRPH